MSCVVDNSLIGKSNVQRLKELVENIQHRLHRCVTTTSFARNI